MINPVVPKCAPVDVALIYTVLKNTLMFDVTEVAVILIPLITSFTSLLAMGAFKSPIILLAINTIAAVAAAVPPELAIMPFTVPLIWVLVRL
jgi:hypothetical protein